MTPTQRALAECKRRGWTAQVVEQTIRAPGRTFKCDLFGCIDIIAITPFGILGIQVTSGTNHAARCAKICDEPRMVQWCKAGAYLSVWSWSKRGPRGKRKVWTLRETNFVATLSGRLVRDLQDEQEAA